MAMFITARRGSESGMTFDGQQTAVQRLEEASMMKTLCHEMKSSVRYNCMFVVRAELQNILTSPALTSEIAYYAYTSGIQMLDEGAAPLKQCRN